MDRVFEVKDEKVYMTKLNIFYEDIGIVLDRAAGLIKYGEFSKGLDDWYNAAVKRYTMFNMEYMVKDMFLFRFENYKNILTIEEICILLNYIFMVSSNGDKIFAALNGDTEYLKLEIARLKELGF